MNARSTNFIIILLLLSVSFCFSQQREAQPVEFKRITENLYEITGGSGANGGLYVGDDCALVIDAKMDKKSVDEVLGGIRQITDKPVKYLINTHSDGDHINGNRYFPQMVTIVAHENCRKEFFHASSSGEPSQWNNPELAPYIPSITFTKKMTLYPGSEKVELWYFGIGHTKGDAFVYFPEKKVVFIGDMYFSGRPQLIHSYKGGNSFDYVNTVMEMLRTLDANEFYSGHSEMVTREQIYEHLGKVRSYQEKVKSLMEEGLSLMEIQKQFADSETRLVTSIYNEIKSK